MTWLNNLFGGKPSKNDFAKTVMKFLSASGAVKKLDYDADKFAIFDRDDDGDICCTFYLNNAYSDYCRAPKGEREKLLSSYFAPSSNPNLPTTLNEAIFHILPRLQPLSTFENTLLLDQLTKSQYQGQKQNAPAKSDPAPRKTIGTHYCLALVFDTAQSVMYLDEKTLQDWQTSFDELLPRAITNLTGLTPEPFQRIKQGIYYSDYADSHDASRLVVTHRIEECRVKGRPLAFTPNRNTLLITGENDPEGIGEALKIVEATRQEPRPMPVFPLVYEAGEWQLWQPPADHPCIIDLDKWRTFAMGDLYAEQRHILDQKLQQENQDLFVASFAMVQRNDSQEVFSYATWTKGVRTLLPLTDSIAFIVLSGKQGEMILMAPRTIVQQVMGDTMQALDYYPPRLLVDTFPTNAQIEQMKTLTERSGTNLP